MKLKIHNTEVVSARVDGSLYYEIYKRAEARNVTINDYVINALKQYMGYKEKNDAKK